MIEPRAAIRRTWPSVIELIRGEIRRLVQAGASDVQLDAPQIAMGLADGGWETAEAVDTIAATFEGFTSIRRSVDLCYGDFGARTWVRNRAFSPLLPTIQALGGIVDRVVLELSLPERWAERHLLAEIPAQLEIAAGSFSVHRVASAAAPSNWRWPKSRPWSQLRDRSDVPVNGAGGQDPPRSASQTWSC